MQYTVLTAVIKTEILKFLFKEEMHFVAQHRFLFLEQHPEVIFAINNDAVIVQQLVTIREMMSHVKKLEEQEKQQAVSGLALTGGHR